jgi:N4-gp56 family major capsid protein
MIRSVADKRPARQAMPGSSVVLQIHNDLAQATSALTETTDPDSVAIPSTSSVTVTLNEYGNAALVTRKLQLFSLADVDPAIANIVAFNMADSIDEVAQAALVGGSNIRYATGGASTPAARNEIAAEDIITAADIRFAVAKLRAGKAVPRKGSLFWCGIHPEVSHDLRAETGSGAWRLPHEYQSNEAIWAGEIGTFEGAYFVETPRMKQATDGASSARVFRTILAGQQALAEAVAEEPHTVIGPVTDKLMRFRPIGWYGVLGFARYREASLYRIESSSSINAA